MWLYGESEHQKEMDKINKLESLNKEKNDKLNALRLKTTPCHFKDLICPRSCYFDSNFECSWNTATDRCEKK
ncbi:Hypothetical protein KVN_LOCUS287 [uncultured virus]|nr:Hypothetical protein KVN_LOCUS287 [uncultured virus]